MRKLNYNIEIGTKFKLPKASWQMADVTGNYEIQERKTKPDYEGGTEVVYICVSLDHPNQMPVEIAEMTLAYLLGEDVDGFPNITYDGKQYQPTGLDDYRVATEWDGVEYSEPFWYLVDYIDRYCIDVDFCRGFWCFFSLPWD